MSDVIDDARQIDEHGPLAAPGAVSRLTPFASLVLIAIVSIPLDPPSDPWVALLVTCLAVVAMCSAIVIPWTRLPRWTQGAVVLTPLLLVAFFMRSQDGLDSHFLGLMLIPLIWLALYETRAALWTGLIFCTALVLLQAVPTVSGSEVLRASVMLGTALIILPAIRRLVTDHRMALTRVEEQGDELRRLAEFDALTGLPNRSLAEERIKYLLAEVQEDSGKVAVLFVDLDDFKRINDAYGHRSGDFVLQAVAQRLTSNFREADVVGRLGADKFVIALDCSEIPQTPVQVARRIVEVLGRPFDLEQALPMVALTASVGVSVSGSGTAEDLLHTAVVALHRSKAAGKNGYVVFRPSMETHLRAREVTDDALALAIEHEQLQLVYQPLYNLESRQPVAVEALLRWQHPTHGLLSAGAFMPAVESSGKGLEIGGWVLDEACAQMAAMRASGARLDLSVNLYAEQLSSDRIVEQVRGALVSSGLPPCALTLAVPEHALMRDVEASATRLRELKRLGVDIALDHFGSGYLSLAYLHQLSVDSLKIDRRFMEAATKAADPDLVMGTLAQLGKSLHVTTVAVGVPDDEDERDLPGLEDRGVIGPMSAPDLMRTLLETGALGPFVLPDVAVTG